MSVHKPFHCIAVGYSDCWRQNSCFD